MRSWYYKIILLIWLSLILGQPYLCFCDYIMMCTFFGNPVAKVFRMTEDGDILTSGSIEIGGNPESLVFSPDGHWGLAGSHTTYYPPTQKTLVIGANQNREIYSLGYVHCETEKLAAISPDSRYGVYGADLKTLRMERNGDFFPILSNNPLIGGFYAPSSKISNNFLTDGGYNNIIEFTLLDDGRTTTTGFSLDISPSDGGEDLEISPDGKTAIALGGSGGGSYCIAVLRIFPEGGFALVQQFNSSSYNPMEVDFTPDSKYAIIVFWCENANIRSYAIGADSKLTEVGSTRITPYTIPEDMAVTPDGKFAVTRVLEPPGSVFQVVRIYSDGSLEYLPEKNFGTTGAVSAIDFLPPYQPYPENSFVLY